MKRVLNATDGLNNTLTFKHLGRMGRLGNQLFQIAATMGIARRLSMDAVFPPWAYADFFSGPIPQAATISADLPTYLEPSYHFQNPEINTSANLSGFFQSEKYFLHIQEEVRAKLCLHPKIQSHCQAKLKSLQCEQMCSIHVRRGDYVGHPDFVDLGATDYYEQAMECFEAATVFLLFSDDLAYCKQRFNDPRIRFVQSSSELFDLSMMMQCDHHIIANSSFSWWGAWLNASKTKVVVAPQKWFAGRFADPGLAFVPGFPPEGFHDTRDLLPAAWRKI